MRNYSVEHFYNQFPYPSNPLKEGKPEDLDWRFCVHSISEFCNKFVDHKLDHKRELSILDAGCGTGVSTNQIGFLNPGSTILSIDISRNSLDLASQRIHKSGAGNLSDIRFQNISLFDLRCINKFDYINSIGVLQHLDDPLSGLKSLELLLKPGGLIYLLLYAKTGRDQINRIKSVFRSIGLTHSSEDISLAKELISGLPSDNDIKRKFENKNLFFSGLDAKFIDLYMHPKEIDFSVHSLFDLISS